MLCIVSITVSMLCIVSITISMLCIVSITISNPSVEASLRTILDSISTLTADWFNLGVALGLSYDTLKTIESNYRDAHRCQTEMVMAWLRMKDNALPSWQALASALSSPSINRIEIANMIASEHPHIS